MFPPLGDGGIQFYDPFVKKWFRCNNIKTPQHYHFKITCLDITFTDQVRISLYMWYFAFFCFCYDARHIFYGPTSRRQGIRFI